jgi:hypothetical protein
VLDSVWSGGDGVDDDDATAADDDDDDDGGDDNKLTGSHWRNNG